MKIRILLLGLAMALTMGVQAQKTKSNANTQNATVSAINDLRQEMKTSDSIITESLKAIENQLKAVNESLSVNNNSNKNSDEKPRYKMYQTENVYNLLKLDTRYGQVWQVQYQMNNVEAQVLPINFGVAYDCCNGRFELYPTKNMYNFIMLDTKTGDTYQVQWSTTPEYRSVIKIE